MDIFLFVVIVISYLVFGDAGFGNKFDNATVAAARVRFVVR